MKYLFLLLFPLLLAASCAKEEYDPLDELPPATQEGRYKMGCLIDGAPWKNNGGNAFNPSIFSVYNNNLNRITVRGYEQGPMQPNVLQRGLRFRVTSPSVGVKNLARHEADFEILYNDGSDATTYLIDTLSTSLIEVTMLNQSARIIAGTFEFVLVSEDGTERLEVTDGRFDVVYQ